jgi:hypothetical protein
MKLSRRMYLKAIVTTVLSPLHKALGQETPSPAYSDEEIVDILIDEAGGSPEIKTVVSGFWFQQPEGKRPNPHWSQDEFSYDCAHLSEYTFKPEPFSISANDLTSYMSICSYSRNENHLLLFGLRGAALLSGSSTPFAESHDLQEATPDHINPRCLLGVLDLGKNQLALFSGSTVPNVDLMQKQAEGTLPCNMMPTGAHSYVVGAHKKSKQPGAFRQLDPLWVHRAKGQLIYSFNDPQNEWDDNNGAPPADNIHAAILSYNTRPPFFSSAGCQVVVGDYTKNGVPIGAWESFRRAAGLAHPPEIVGKDGATTDDGKKFIYILLTGKEARMLHAGHSQALRSLRFGSQGTPVSALQEFLARDGKLGGNRISGRLDRLTVASLLRWQIANGLPPTGIVSDRLGSEIGIWK